MSECLQICPCLDRVASIVSERFKNRFRWNEEKGEGDVHRLRQLEEESWRAGRETLWGEKDTEAVAETQSTTVENRKAGKRRQSVYR